MKSIIFSPNSLNEWEACEYRWDLYKQRNLEPMTKSHYLEEGDLLHMILQNHYLLLKKKQTEDPNLNYLDIVQDSVGKGRILAAELSLDSQDVEEVISLYQEYAEFRRNDFFQILAVEQAFAKVLYERPDTKCNKCQDGKVTILVSSKLGKIDCTECLGIGNLNDGVRIIIEGKIDLIGKTKDELQFWDHKKVSRNEAMLVTDNQFSAYAWVGDGVSVVRNSIGTQTSLKPHEKFTRDTINYTKLWLEDWRMDAIFHGLNMLKAIEAGENAYYPKRFNACKTRYGTCRFYDICRTTPDNREYKMRTLFRVAEPFTLWAHPGDKK